MVLLSVWKPVWFRFVRLMTIVLQIGLLTYCTTVQGQILTHNLQGTNVNSLIALNATDILLATSRGLLRFDGKKFDEFPIQVAGQMLPLGEIVDLVIDNDQNIWVASKGGLYVREGLAWKYLDRNSGAPESTINGLFVDSYGRVWLGTEKDGVTIFIGKDKHRINKTNYEVFKNGAWTLKADLQPILPKALKDIRAIVQDKSGRIWLGTERGVIQFSAYRGILDSAVVKASSHWKHFLETKSILSIKADNQGGVWVGTLQDGVFHFESTGAYQNFKPGDVLGGISVLGEDAFLDWNRIKTIAQDQEDNLWFGTALGVCRFNPNTQSSNNRWRCMGPEIHSSFRGGIETIFNDSDNNLWFGLSIGQGLLRFNNNWFTFGTESLGKFPFVKALLVNNNDVWVGLSNELFRLKGEDTLRAMPAGRNQIWSLSPAKNSQVWVGTFGDGVFLYDENGVQLCHLDTMGRPDAMGNRLIDPYKQVVNIIERNNEIWIATRGGLSRFSLLDSTWTNYTQKEGELISNFIFSIVFDRSGKLWCGTEKGVSRLNPNSGKWEPPLTTDNGLSNNVVTTIASHPTKNEMWLGTDGGGISIYNGTGWQYLTHPAVLADNVINQIVFTQNGNEVWVATPGGISRRDKNGVWANFSTQSGLASNFVQCIALQGDSLRWFGTWGSGLTRYRPPKSFPETFIDSRLDVTDKSEVTYHFSAADLNTAQNEFRFQYWIDNEKPSEPTVDRFAVVAIPEPVIGPHTFYVQAIDRDGNQDQTPDRDFFTVIVPKFGGAAVTTDTTFKKTFAPITVSVYWPPNLLKENTAIVEPDTTVASALFAYRLASSGAFKLRRPIRLTFSFPEAAVKGRNLGIFKVGSGNQLLLLGGNEPAQKENKMFSLSTAILELGVYAVKARPENQNPASDSLQNIFRVTAQPRIIHADGREHGSQITITFKLDAAAPVRLEVYNLAGRLVGTIWNGNMQAGINTVTWNGRDKNGDFCPPGLYLIAIISNGFQSPPKPIKVMVMN